MTYSPAYYIAVTTGHQLGHTFLAQHAGGECHTLKVLYDTYIDTVLAQKH